VSIDFPGMPRLRNSHPRQTIHSIAHSQAVCLGGLGLQPTDKVLDLEQRLVCRLCLARGQAAVSIKRKATS
jgi:hypothetical protein